MADISLCSGQGCEKKGHCYRFTAVPNEYRQSYFSIAPEKVEECEYFWGNDEFFVIERKKEINSH